MVPLRRSQRKMASKAWQAWQAASLPSCARAERRGRRAHQGPRHHARSLRNRRFTPSLPGRCPFLRCTEREATHVWRQWKVAAVGERGQTAITKLAATSHLPRAPSFLGKRASMMETFGVPILVRQKTIKKGPQVEGGRNFCKKDERRSVRTKSVRRSARHPCPRHSLVPKRILDHYYL